MELHQEVASILNQLGFQVNGKQLDAHNVVAMFAAIGSRIGIAASEGSAVGLGLAAPLHVAPAVIGAPVDPAAPTARARRILGLPPAPPLLPDWWRWWRFDLDGRPSPNLEPDAWADGGRPGVALDDPEVEPVSSPPAPWPEPSESPSEPPTPTETRDPGVSAGSVALSPVSHPVPLGPKPDLREMYCSTCPDVPENPDAVPGACCLDPGAHPEPGTDPPPDPDRWPDPLLEPSLWDAAVPPVADPDRYPDPLPATFEAVREDSRRQVERAFEVEPALLGSAPGDPYCPDHPYHASWSSWRPTDPSPWLLKRRARTRNGVAVPALYPGGHDAGRVITIPLPEVDWLDPATTLPTTWLAHAGIPEHAAVGRNPFSVARPLPDPCGLCEHGERCDCPPPAATPDPAAPDVLPAYPVPEGE